MGELKASLDCVGIPLVRDKKVKRAALRSCVFYIFIPVEPVHTSGSESVFPLNMFNSQTLS